MLEKCGGRSIKNLSLKMHWFKKDGATAHAATATVVMLQCFLRGPHFQKY